jgi:hypothetical protein
MNIFLAFYNRLIYYNSGGNIIGDIRMIMKEKKVV